MDAIIAQKAVIFVFESGVKLIVLNVPTYRDSGQAHAHKCSAMADVDIHEEAEEKHFKQIYKILIIGDSNVGKTALLTRYVEGRFQSAFMSTVGEHYTYSYMCVIVIGCSVAAVEAARVFISR